MMEERGVLMKDIVYYLEIEGEFFPDVCFECEEDAIQYADEHALNVTNIIEWDVA